MGYKKRPTYQENGFNYYILSDDHYPPHIHIINSNNGHYGRFYIDTGEIFSGNIKLGLGKIKKVIVKEKNDLFKEKWNELNPNNLYECWLKQGSWRNGEK